MSVLPSPIPHPLDYCPWDLPGWAYEALEWVVGFQWPDGNEAQIWEVADRWYAVAGILAGPRQDAIDAAGQIITGYGGAGVTIDAFRTSWNEISADENAPLNSLLAISREIGKMVEECGCDIEGAKLEAWIELGIFVIDLIGMAVAVVLTLGAASPAAGGLIAAARFAIQQIFKKLLESLGKKALRKSLKEAGQRAAEQLTTRAGLRRLRREALDEGLEEATEEYLTNAGIQVYQNSTGRRDGLDWHELGRSTAGGFAAGLAASGASLGRGRHGRPLGDLMRGAGGEILGEFGAAATSGRLPDLEEVAKSATSGMAGSAMHSTKGELGRALSGLTVPDMSTMPMSLTTVHSSAQAGEQLSPSSSDSFSSSSFSASPSPPSSASLSPSAGLSASLSSPPVLPASQSDPSLSATAPPVEAPAAHGVRGDPTLGGAGPAEGALSGAKVSPAVTNPPSTSLLMSSPTTSGMSVSVPADSPSVAGPGPRGLASSGIATEPQVMFTPGTPYSDPDVRQPASLFWAPQDGASPTVGSVPNGLGPTPPGGAPGERPGTEPGLPQRDAGPRVPEKVLLTPPGARGASPDPAPDEDRYFDRMRSQRQAYAEVRRDEQLKYLAEQAERDRWKARVARRSAAVAQYLALRPTDAALHRARARSYRDEAERFAARERVLQGNPAAMGTVYVDSDVVEWNRLNTDVEQLAPHTVKSGDRSALSGIDRPPPIDRTRIYGRPYGLRPPLAQHQLDLEDAMPRDSHGNPIRTADPRLRYFKLVNDGGSTADPTRGINCQDCVLSFFETYLHGRPRVAAPRTFDAYLNGDPERPSGGEQWGTERVELVTGGKFQALCGDVSSAHPAVAKQKVDGAFANVERQLRAGGHGSFAFIVNSWEGGSAHAWCAINQGGEILFVDPQVAQVAGATVPGSVPTLYRHKGVPDDFNVTRVDALVVNGQGRVLDFANAPDGNWHVRNKTLVPQTDGHRGGGGGMSPAGRPPDRIGDANSAALAAARRDVLDYVGPKSPVLANIVVKLIDDHAANNHPLNLTSGLMDPRRRPRLIEILNELGSSDAMAPYRTLDDFIEANPGKGGLFQSVAAQVNTDADGRSRKQEFVDRLKAIDPVRAVGQRPTAAQRILLEEYADVLALPVRLAAKAEVQAVAEGAVGGAAHVSARAKDAEELTIKVARMINGSKRVPPRPNYRVGDVIDAVGARITVPDMQTLSSVFEHVKAHFGTGRDGRILEIENMYAKPKPSKPAYRVIPLVITIEVSGDQYTFELQLSTERASVAADIEHNTLFKGYVETSLRERRTVMAVLEAAAALDQLETVNDD